MAVLLGSADYGLTHKDQGTWKNRSTSHFACARIEVPASDKEISQQRIVCCSPHIHGGQRTRREDWWSHCPGGPIGITRAGVQVGRVPIGAGNDEGITRDVLDVSDGKRADIFQGQRPHVRPFQATISAPPAQPDHAEGPIHDQHIQNAVAVEISR